MLDKIVFCSQLCPAAWERHVHIVSKCHTDASARHARKGMQPTAGNGVGSDSGVEDFRQFQLRPGEHRASTCQVSCLYREGSDT
uniref:Secreted protein n=1 Tax=Steinernema glaseri TaxID=37863 RepID=A0A1I7YP70_9BILA